jgi:nitroreductase
MKYFCHIFLDDFMTELNQLIKKRHSCRTYADKPVEEKILEELERLVADKHTSPFGNTPKFHLINLDFVSTEARKDISTYGIIRNARLFLVGAIKKEDRAVIDYGYCMENLILRATALELGTCWIAGTFNTEGFAKAIKLQENELLPAISPVGYPADSKSFIEKMFRFAAGSERRKPWADLFFIDNFNNPSTPSRAGKYFDALENVRLAPSASNLQPWRILQDTASNSFHFYLECSFGYKMRGFPIQNIDMGIAMNHFELTARELGISGQWKIKDNVPAKSPLIYIVSWQENG